MFSLFQRTATEHLQDTKEQPGATPKRHALCSPKAQSPQPKAFSRDACHVPAFSTDSLTHISQFKTQLFSDNVGLCEVKIRGIFGSEPNLFGRNIVPHGIYK